MNAICGMLNSVVFNVAGLVWGRTHSVAGGIVECVYYRNASGGGGVVLAPEDRTHII